MIQRSLTIVNCSVLIRILQRQECTIGPGFLNHKTGFRNQLLGYRNQHLTSRVRDLSGRVDRLEGMMRWMTERMAASAGMDIPVFPGPGHH
ncbi:hypothetical protein E3N88_43459 [Mikania micrantha]|uniref:Uncharacterized protein n=1 Tax=Mikania micrantha TaxID=192012 RepID=A0A5N6LFR4_9ASTR|nr:hypothetical protein E3N88_43459 [Mikania micrantha]